MINYIQNWYRRKWRTKINVQLVGCEPGIIYESTKMNEDTGAKII